MGVVVLGIESTAHTFGAGVFDSSGGRILANERSVFSPPAGRGMIPRDCADHHSAECGAVLGRVFSKVKPGEIGAVAYSRGPGLGPVLRVGLACARSLSGSLGRPLVGVNHAVAHIEVGKWATKARDPVVLYVSGGNTQVIALSSGRYRVFGETLDIPIGNALDVLARNLGLPFPGGPRIEELASRGAKLIDLPYVVKGMDLSYSGLLTHCTRLAKTEKLEDVCFSFQEHCFAMLAEVTERAVAHTGKSEVMAVGGVAANRRLAQMLRTMCEERGAEFTVVPLEYAGDNGAMIAVTGALMAARPEKPEDATVDQRFRVDEQDVFW